jgi:hypothetical protein
VIPLAVRTGAPLVLLAAAGAGAWWWGASKYSAGEAAGRAAERAVWEGKVAEAGQKFGQALADQQQVLQGTETALQRARRAAARRQEGLSDAVRNDPASAEWGAARIPDAVRVYLDAGAAGDPGLPGDP